MNTFVTPSLARLLCAAALAPCLALAQPAKPEVMHPYAPSQVIAGKYIIVFKAEVQDPAQEAANLMRAVNGQVHRTFTHAIKGFAASIPEVALSGISRHPKVASIEPDQTVSLNQLTSPQNQVTWGLDRVDQLDRPLDSQYFFNYRGDGVTVFVIDTGINAGHQEFTGRVQPGFNVIADSNGTNDCNGHGTHVAGTVGGTTSGVAKAVQLVPVRVLDCSGSGSLSGVVAGIDWAAGTSLRPAVANLSLGSSKSTSVNAAVAGAVSKGITVVVAAGNSNANACNYSPASEPTAITVGATTSSDARASYSNYGSCVDIFAPGSGITSAWVGSATATNTINGTSMASPHVAGVAALALQANASATPAAVANFLMGNAAVNKLTSLGTGSPNRLVFSLASGAPGVVVTQTVAIKSLTGSAQKSGKKWLARVTTTVRDVSTGADVANALVSGSFSPGGSASCTTGSTGSCTLSSASLANTVTMTSFEVGKVAGAGLNYDASQNSASKVSITKP